MDRQKTCQRCGIVLSRKRYSGGRLEDKIIFERRKFCSVTCANSRTGDAPHSKAKTPTAPPADGQVFDSAEAYLEAVVSGGVAPDAVRVAAAKALLPYQTVKQRAPRKALTPTQLAVKETRALESAVVIEFEAKAAEIRARHARRNKDGNS